MTTSYKETFERFALYFLAILLSPILFGILLASYSMIAVQDAWGFAPTVFVVALYSFPFFALLAFPVSLYIDFSARFNNYSNSLKTLLYAGVGSLAGLLGSVILYDLFSLISMILLGAIGGVLHFLVLTLIKKVFK
ncbi:hypothetical protein M3197_13790 [Sporosarcina aquimarina]|uniref:hypothetical protein n=1 Tax=Sporosarcina aquimarina TaxID=114975 RepID=UPI00203C099B|nr:hypothetical protein [Sporosarcina aquimarina]MCM3758533.1 hypothetical protein [Sporosarcina aquimarina]